VFVYIYQIAIFAQRLCSILSS